MLSEIGSESAPSYTQTMERAFLYIGIFAIGFITVSLWSFWLAVRPPRIAIPYTPEVFGLSVEPAAIETSDGLKLAVWFIPQQGTGSGSAVILLHGYPAEKADMLPIASVLRPYFTTLLLDMRYFGQSQGRFTTLGFRERDDLKRAVDFLVGRGFEHIGVFGFSLGGAVGITTAFEDSRIRAVAAYAPFADLRRLGREAYARVWILKYPLVELMRFWGLVFFGGDVVKPSPAEAASRLAIPVLIVHGREDEQIPFAHAEQLKALLAGNPQAEFYFLERGRHGELPTDFNERISNFFLRNLR